MFSILYGTYFPFLSFPKQALVFMCLQYKSKTLWEKEKLFVMSNFSFSYSVFLPI